MPAASFITCTRRIEFDAAHRVTGHESKCRYLHGHRYVIEATFTAKALDSLGRVIDFGKVKEILGAWVEENWDHNTILFNADQSLGLSIEQHTRQKVYYLPYNPTAEYMALYLLEVVVPKLFAQSELTCTAVKIWETPNCSAIAVITQEPDN